MMKIEVTGSSGNRYKIQQHADGSFSCTCNAWRFQRVEPSVRHCKHMDQAVLSLGGYVVGARERAQRPVAAAS